MSAADYTDLAAQLMKWRPNDTEFVMLTEADWAKVVAMALGPNARPHDTIGVEVMLVELQKPEPEYRCHHCDEWVTTYLTKGDRLRRCDQCGYATMARRPD